MQKLHFTAPSSDGVHTLQGVLYLPEGRARGYFHAVHGMTEHIARYDRFLSDLAEEGYLAFGYDHLGHGNTAMNERELGYIADHGGDELLCRDVKAFSDAVRAKYDAIYGASLPYFLMGHSMGSFVTRLAVEKSVFPDRYIIMGTGGSNPLAGAGLLLAKAVGSVCGKHHISKLLDSLMFGTYNERFGGGSPEDPSPWLTRDETVRKLYYADRFCNYKFTTRGLHDLICLTKRANRAAWYRNLNKELPILLVSGAEDPVSGYGKGVLEVEKKLKAAGCDARAILYPDARHEILNDSTYTQVKEDILSFLQGKG